MGQSTSQYWIRRPAAGAAHKSWGPLSAQQIRHLASTGKLRTSDEVAASPEGPWRKAGFVKGLAIGSDRLQQAGSSSPPPPPPPPFPSLRPDANGPVESLAQVDGVRQVFREREEEYFRTAAALSKPQLPPAEMARLYTSLERLAADGCPLAAFEIAASHDLGLGLPKDAALAWKWMKRAAELGHPEGRAVVTRLVLTSQVPDGAADRVLFGRITVEGVQPRRTAIGAGTAGTAVEDHRALLVRCGAIATDRLDGLVGATVIGGVDVPIEQLIATAKDRTRSDLLFEMRAMRGFEGSCGSERLMALCRRGTLPVLVSLTDYRAMRESERDAPGSSIRVSVPRTVDHGERVELAILGEGGVRRSVIGLLVFPESTSWRGLGKSDRRYKSGHRPGMLHTIDPVKVCRSAHDQTVEHARLLQDDPNAPARIGHYPIPLRFLDEYTVKQLGPRALGCEYKPALFMPATYAASRVKSSETSPVARMFWLAVACQFERVEETPEGFKEYFGFGRQSGVGMMGLDPNAWLLSEQDEAQAIELARQWLRRFWPGLGFTPPPDEELRQVASARQSHRDRNLPIPSRPDEFEALRKLVNLPIVGPQPPGITQLQNGKLAVPAKSVKKVLLLAWMTGGLSLLFTYKHLLRKK